MLPVKWSVKISLLLMVCTSGVLLGASQGNQQLTLVSVVGATLGFIVCDCWGRFQLKGWLANIASIAILIYSMRDFFDGNGAMKLVAVSNLLVYLQTVLMFQEKTPRLNWQVMVLSLLQAVVAAIFNLNFEGGILFAAYFLVSGVTMALQSTYSDQVVVQRANRRAAKTLAKHVAHRSSAKMHNLDQSRTEAMRPVAIFDVVDPPTRPVTSMIKHLAMWMVMSVVFTVILFYTIPRSNAAWFGPKFRQTQKTGASKEVNLDTEGKIEQSGRMFARVSFEGRRSREKIKIAGSIYLRGMALGRLEIVDDKTTWKAPYDRIDGSSYTRIVGRLGRGRIVRQKVLLEPTDDPLLHVSMPLIMIDTPSEMEFCHELSGFTRRNHSDQIELSPYSFQAFTKLNDRQELLDSWPYFTNMDHRLYLPMTQDTAKTRWLTEMEPERYPELVRVSEELADQYAEMRKTSFRRFLKVLESYFLDTNRFTYTIDYTEVVRDRSIDPIEDFFANHRSGHCEMYASAMTLMLRNLGIPARMVVGFNSTEYSESSKGFVVRENHAHAWVEAYVPPEGCTDEMFSFGGADAGGAWLRLDPTPPRNVETSESSIELARNFWQDYVLGLDKENQNQDLFRAPTSMLGLFDLGNWSQQMNATSGSFLERPIWQLALIGAVLLAMLFGLFRMLAPPATKKKSAASNAQKSSLIRRFVGNALSYLSPELGKWVLGDPDEIQSPFYRDLVRLLQKNELERKPTQTQNEFAEEVVAHFSDHPQSDGIAASVWELTREYYRARFGGQTFEKNRLQELNQRVTQLEEKLRLKTGS